MLTFWTSNLLDFDLLDFDHLASSTFSPSNCQHKRPVGSYNLLCVGLPVSNLRHSTFRSLSKWMDLLYLFYLYSVFSLTVKICNKNLNTAWLYASLTKTLWHRQYLCRNNTLLPYICTNLYGNKHITVIIIIVVELLHFTGLNSMFQI